MRIREPGVHGNSRDLDRKGDKKAERAPHGRRPCHRRAQQLDVVKGVDTGLVLVQKDQGQYRYQHEQATRLGEEKKFYRRIDAVFVPPDADQKIHRHQHYFPEDVKQQ